MYNSTSIRGALPVGDWRIELRPDGKLSESYRKLRGKNEPDWDFLPNDGDSHNEHLCNNTVMLYLQPDKITVRRKKATISATMRRSGRRQIHRAAKPSGPISQTSFKISPPGQPQ